MGNIYAGQTMQDFCIGPTCSAVDACRNEFSGLEGACRISLDDCVRLRRSPLRESLAAEVHEAWSGWMRYLFGKCIEVGDGCLEIPAWAVKRWRRQMNTPYSELPEEEKQSDRDEADRYLSVLDSSDEER